MAKKHVPVPRPVDKPDLRLDPAGPPGFGAESARYAKKHFPTPPPPPPPPRVPPTNPALSMGLSPGMGPTQSGPPPPPFTSTRGSGSSSKPSKDSGASKK